MSIIKGAKRRSREKFLGYVAGQAARMLLSAACSFAIGYLIFDWMIQIFDPISAVFVLAAFIGLGGCMMFLILDKITVRRRK